MKKFWEVKNAADDTGELYIYGEITPYKWDDTDTTAQSFKEDLDALGTSKRLTYTSTPRAGASSKGKRSTTS